MSEQQEFFTKDQNRLMSIAGWANNLAWVMLVVYLILTLLTISLDKADYQRMHALTGGFASSSDYWKMARADMLYYLLDIGSDMLTRVLTGFMYYVVLKGISLGLYMVIETNMNYHEKKNQEGGR